MKIAQAPEGWYGYTRGYCGASIASDLVCDRLSGHYFEGDGTKPASYHRAHDPSGTGQYIDFDKNGDEVGRGPQPVDKRVDKPASDGPTMRDAAWLALLPRACAQGQCWHRNDCQTMPEQWMPSDVHPHEDNVFCDRDCPAWWRKRIAEGAQYMRLSDAVEYDGDALRRYWAEGPGSKPLDSDDTMGAAIAEAIHAGQVHDHSDGVAYPDTCGACRREAREREDRLRGLMEPEKVQRRVRSSRRRGVGGLLPEVEVISQRVETLFGEVPVDYMPGGSYMSTESDVAVGARIAYEHRFGGSYDDRLQAARDLVAYDEARERVMDFLMTRDGESDEVALVSNDVIHIAYPPGGAGVDGVDLRWSDLRTLVGMPQPQRFDE